MIGAIRLLLRAPLSILCVLIITPCMCITSLLGMRGATRAIMSAGFAYGAWLWGVHVEVRGTLAPGRPMLLVSNHFSYLDMFVIGSKIPAAFTPKSEIAHWPVIGFACKAAGCLFIDRRISKTKENTASLHAALEHGDIIHLFPEGTTNDGTKLLPFKSSYFSIAEGTPMPVQPASIRYTALNGNPIMPADYAKVGWFGHAEFFPHVVSFLQQQSLHAVLVLHPPVYGRDFESRKALASYCQQIIDGELNQSAKKNAPE